MRSDSIIMVVHSEYPPDNHHRHRSDHGISGVFGPQRRFDVARPQ